MKLLRLIHAWAGTILSLLLAVLGLSGTLLVFKNDYVRATVPYASTDAIVTTEAFAGAIGRIDASKGAKQIKFVVLASEHLGVHQIGFKDDSSAFATSSGELVANWGKNGRVEEWLLDLHHHLLNGDSGEIVAGVAGLMAIVLTISGLVIWLPTMRMFSLSIVPRSLKRGDLMRAHRNIGVMMVVPIIMITLTGAAIAFTDQTRFLLAKTLPSQETPKPPRASAGVLDWDAALIAAQTAFPDAKMRLVIWPKKPTEPLTIRLKQPAEWHPNGRTIVWIDPSTSQIVGTVDALKLKSAQSVFNGIYPVHAAKLGDGIVGRLVDVLTALVGLSLTALGLIGALSFIRSLGRPKKRRASQPLPQA